MRVSYTPPTAEQFELILKKKKSIGGGLNDIQTFNSPVYYQQGGGLFSFIGNVIRRSLPILKQIFLPAAADMGRDIVHDYAQGITPKNSIKKRGPEHVRKIVKKFVGGKKKNIKKTKRKSKGRVLKTRQSPCSRSILFK